MDLNEANIMTIEIIIIIVSISLAMYLILRNDYKLYKCIMNKQEPNLVPIPTTNQIIISDIAIEFQTNILNIITSKLTPDTIVNIKDIKLFLQSTINDTIDQVKATMKDISKFPSNAELQIIVNNISTNLFPIITSAVTAYLISPPTQKA